jgi:hypothetical protein
MMSGSYMNHRPGRVNLYFLPRKKQQKPWIPDALKKNSTGRAIKP